MPRRADRALTPGGRASWLAELNPLAKLAAALPLTATLALTDAPVACALVAIACLLMLAHGAPPAGRWMLGALAFFGLGSLFALAMACWTDPARSAAGGPSDALALWEGLAGPVTLSTLAAASTTAMRIMALIALTALASAMTTRTDLVRALIAQLRMPYRIGYAAFAASGFVRHFRTELRIIRDAKRVRRGRRRLGTWSEVPVLLLGSALRHADDMALAMESRSFGAFPTRTERVASPWRRRDWACVAIGTACCAVTVAGATTGISPSTLDMLRALPLV